jgi:hypothetical protein
MRAAALIAVLACVATAAHADGSRESRYGPAPERAPTPMDGRSPGYTGATYGGRALGWAGKREIVAPEAQAASQVQPWWARSAPQAAQAPQRTARPAPPISRSAPPVAPQARALPQSIYEAPARRRRAGPGGLRRAHATAPQFQPGQIGARTYSVGRQFGMTRRHSRRRSDAHGPDRPAASAPEDDKPREDDDRDWPAQERSGKDKKDSDQ